jgi:hypothetical protein
VFDSLDVCVDVCVWPVVWDDVFSGSAAAHQHVHMCVLGGRLEGKGDEACIVIDPGVPIDRDQRPIEAFKAAC